MIKFLFTLIFVLSVELVFAQSQTSEVFSRKLSETDSLYLLAFKKYINHIDNYFNQKELNTIYLDYQDYLNFIPDSLDGHRIIKLWIPNRRKYFKKSKNNLRLVKIFPLTIEDKKFRISIVPYFAKLNKRNQLDLALSNWTRVYFTYDNGRLIFEKIENGGI